MTTHRPPSDEAPATLPRLRAILDAYGSDPGRWPRAERNAVQALIDSDPAARAALAEATQLDALLDMVSAPAPSAALAERIEHRRFGWRGLPVVALCERLGTDIRRWMTRPRHQVAALACALLVGVLVGTEVPSGPQTGAPSAKATAVRALPAMPADAVAHFSVAPAVSGASRTVASADSQYSSNGDPSFDAPDPFGQASHGLDLVDGARLSSVPVPPSGEPIGSIPLL